MAEKYEMVIGLETHVELKTQTKIFCSCSTKFGAEPNSQTCPICLGFPGTVPVLNEQVVKLGVKAGLATNCRIAKHSRQDRKHYFYPDLGKAYQISQFDLPLCEEGYLDIQVGETEKRVRINRIHIEEDAGKIIHTPSGSLMDYNRSGMPLIEIVTEPDIRSAEEAKAYLQKLRSILLYAEISDAKMNEGSLRCDVNLSVREKGAEKFGTRTEMKNLNSFSAIVRAIEHEFKRQVALIEGGEEVIQETRRWIDEEGRSTSMRSKEEADDYRYFPDPDLLPILVRDSEREAIRESLPTLPDERKRNYMQSYGLSAYEADQLCIEKSIADYFEESVERGASAKLLTNILLSEVFRLLGKNAGEEGGVIPFGAEKMALLCKRIDEGVISQAMAKKVIEKMWQSDASPDEIIDAEDLRQITDRAYLTEMAKEILTENVDVVDSYKAGKGKAFQALVGIMMRQTKGKASPNLAAEIFEELLTQLK